MNSSSTFKKLASSTDHADRLKGFQEKIRVALEELQVRRSSFTVALLAHTRHD